MLHLSMSLFHLVYFLLSNKPKPKNCCLLKKSIKIFKKQFLLSKGSDINYRFPTFTYFTIFTSLTSFLYHKMFLGRFFMNKLI